MQNYISNPSIVSRKNQDGTSIVMKLDNSNVFYKITGLSSILWSFFQTAVSQEMLIESVQTQPSDASFETQARELFSTFLNQGLIVPTAEPIPSQKLENMRTDISSAQNASFGELKEFNLEQIENEVLNESIYLDVFAGSDLRLKTDLSSIQNPLGKITNLDGVHFSWNQNVASPFEKGNGLQTGLLAQQVYEQMPELIKKDEVSGYMAVNYTKLIPYLVESIKELKGICDQQASEISELKKAISSTH